MKLLSLKSMPWSIRVAEDRDAPAILHLYSFYIEHTAFTFEYEIPTEEDFTLRIQKYLYHYPWIICELDGALAGYAYAGKHRERKAYQWSVESSVYVHNNFQGRGIAGRLYDTLFEMLRRQGIVNVYAGITQPNDKSVGFHRKYGFKEVGVYKNIGYKLGKWHDVMWMFYALSQHPPAPADPIAFHQFHQDAACQEILRSATSEMNRKNKN